MGEIPDIRVHDAPDELAALLTEAGEREAFLRTKGASEERIRTQVKKPLARKLAMLAARGIDVSSALPPEAPELTVIEGGKHEHGLTDDQWREVETLVNTAGKSYDEAVLIVKNR